jgi:hypothetical protein
VDWSGGVTRRDQGLASGVEIGLSDHILLMESYEDTVQDSIGIQGAGLLMIVMGSVRRNRSDKGLSTPHTGKEQVNIYMLGEGR